jgi:hypothetical protein
MRSPEDLHAIFAASEYGRTLDKEVRFGDFKPIDVDNTTWVDVLGDDVNNLLHMPHTQKIAARFCLREAMGDDETRKILLTAATHDWGEAIESDIALPSKTKADEKREEQAFRMIAEDLLGRYDGEELSDIVWDILSKQDEVLGDRFRAIEYIGYNTTAMRAGYMGRAIAGRLIRLPFDRPKTEHISGSLLGLEASLQMQSYPTLAAYAGAYPGIQSIIKEGVPYTQAINEA